jgi:Predicted permeases
MLDDLVLVCAAFLAGILNTIAGGGTFLTFPALVYAGIPPVAANATSAVAVFPGYLGGAVGFLHELKSFKTQSLLKVVAVTVIGGLIGSLLLLISSNETFSAVVPFLLLVATLVFAFGDHIQVWARSSHFGVKPSGAIGTLLVSIYGGYFNGGLGIVLLALFSLWGMRDINIMNGLKNGLSFVLSAISVATFALAGIVAWPQALAMMIAATAGGYIGSPIARALSATVVRGIVIVVGATMSAIFFGRLFYHG